MWRALNKDVPRMEVQRDPPNGIEPSLTRCQGSVESNIAQVRFAAHRTSGEKYTPTEATQKS